MTSYLKLVRFPNLVMIAFTMYAIRWGLIYPMLQQSGLHLQFSALNFLLLVLATVFVTAAGYGINDYFDVRTDSLNRPDRVIVGKEISRRVAIILHWTLNILAVLMSAYISVEIGHWNFSMLFLVTIGLLWYYSTTFKRQFLVGNLVVALLTAMVPMLVVLYEIPSLNKAYATLLLENNTNFLFIVRWVAAFAFFAFVTTLVREIIKDVEDFEGDSAFGRNTLPVVLGINVTKGVIVSLLVGVLVMLYWVYFWKLNDMLSLVYITLVQAVPLVYLIVKTLLANTKRHYGHISLVAKLVMLGGILYVLVVRYNITHL